MKIKETNLKFGKLTARKSTKRVIIHHSAGAGTAASFHRQHVGQGWAGLGYHFVVLPDGTIERGRPEHTVGAHAGPSGNGDSLGVVLVGNFETGKPTPEQMDSLVWLLTVYVPGKYGGRLPEQGHKDVMATACPGKNFPWAELRRRLKVQETTVTVNGETCKAYIIDGATYDEVRKPFEAAGFKVAYNAKTKKTEITK